MFVEVSELMLACGELKYEQILGIADDSGVMWIFKLVGRT